MAKKTPLQTLKDTFGDKKKLVEAVQVFVTDDLWVGRISSDRGGSKGLGSVSNAKLLRLHATFKAVKEKFSTRAGLISAILETEKRTKDEGYKARLEGHPVPRLYDQYKSAQKRAGQAGNEKPASEKAAPAKAEAKAEKAPKAKAAAKPKAEKKG